MNIVISELSTSLLEHLKNLLTQELLELGRDVKRRQQRLNDRVEKRDVINESLDGIKASLDDAEQVLADLNTLNASAETIAKQEAAVAAIQQAYNDENETIGTLTEDESVIEQLAIDRQEASKSIMETEISGIQAELDSR